MTKTASNSPRIGSFFMQVLLAFVTFTLIWTYIRSYLAIPALISLEYLLPASIDIINSCTILKDATGALTGQLQCIINTQNVTPNYGDAFHFQHVVTLNSLMYTYGQISLVALFVATRGRGWWWKLLIGMAILVPSQIFGGYFRVIIETVLSGGSFPLVPDGSGGGLRLAGYLGLSSVLLNLFVFCYQAGYLLMPPLTPILIWFMLEHKKLKQRFTFLLPRARDYSKKTTS